MVSRDVLLAAARHQIAGIATDTVGFEVRPNEFDVGGAGSGRSRRPVVWSGRT
jgi:hypothetical protein